MVKILLTCLISVLLILPGFSQNTVSSLLNGIDAESKKSITQINISGKMLSLAAKNDGSIDTATKELFQNIDKIGVVLGLPINEKLNKQLQKHLTSHEELMSIVEDELNIKMYIKETKEQITEFVLSVVSDNNMMLMSISGKIDLDKITNLSKNVKIEGMEHIDKINTKNKKK